MDWSRWRNPVQNFVNLGRLYQGQSFKVSAPDLNRGQPPGWAYFEDGSIFFPRWQYAHHELQEVMKVAACFVRNPSDGKRTLTRTDNDQTRMILLEKHSSHPIHSPGNLHIYARYAYNGENLLSPSTHLWAIMLELDPTRSFNIATKFYAPFRYDTTVPRHTFMSTQQWLKSSRTFRGTLIDGVLQPDVRLGNGLEFSIVPPSTRDTSSEAAPGPTREQLTPEQGLDTVRSSDGVEWRRQFQYLSLRDFESAADPESSAEFRFSATFEPPANGESIKDGPSLVEHNLELREREAKLQQLNNALLEDQKLWQSSHVPDFKSTAILLESQKRMLRTQGQLLQERQRAWDCCEDNDFRKANLEERERALKKRVEVLKWMEVNWSWVKRLAKAEEKINLLSKTNLRLMRRDERLQEEEKRAVEKGEATLPKKEGERPTLPQGEAKSIFDFLNEDDSELADPLELLRRASGKV